MKNKGRLVVLAGAILLLASAGQSKAQYQAVGDDGIAASPKVRQMLNERKARLAASSTAAQATSYQAVQSDGIAASPKFRQMLEERKVAKTATTSSSQVAGYKAAG